MKDFINKHTNELHQNEEEIYHDTPFQKRENNEMRQFGTGATRDSDDHPDKPNYYKALSPIVLREYVKYIGRHRTLPDGSMRDWDNWKNGIPIDVYMEGLLRHTTAVWLIQHGYKAYDNHGEVTLKDSLNGVMFNTTGFLDEILKAEVEKYPDCVGPYTELNKHEKR